MAQLVRINYTPPSNLDDEVHLKDKKQSAPTSTPRYNRTTASTKISVTRACEMRRLGVPYRCVDIFQGRAPKSILAKHYTGKDLVRLKRICDKANLKVLE